MSLKVTLLPYTHRCLARILSCSRLLWCPLPQLPAVQSCLEASRHSGSSLDPSVILWVSALAWLASTPRQAQDALRSCGQPCELAPLPPSFSLDCKQRAGFFLLTVLPSYPAVIATWGWGGSGGDEIKDSSALLGTRSVLSQQPGEAWVAGEGSHLPEGCGRPVGVLAPRPFSQHPHLRGPVTAVLGLLHKRGGVFSQQSPGRDASCKAWAASPALLPCTS